MIPALCLLLCSALAATVALPPGETGQTWAPVLQAAGLRLAASGQQPDVAVVVEGGRWVVRAPGASPASVRPPRTEAERADLALLLASLALPGDQLDWGLVGPAALPPPPPRPSAPRPEAAAPIPSTEKTVSSTGISKPKPSPPPPAVARPESRPVRPPTTPPVVEPPPEPPPEPAPPAEARVQAEPAPEAQPPPPPEPAPPVEVLAQAEPEPPPPPPPEPQPEPLAQAEPAPEVPPDPDPAPALSAWIEAGAAGLLRPALSPTLGPSLGAGLAWSRVRLGLRWQHQAAADLSSLGPDRQVRGELGQLGLWWSPLPPLALGAGAAVAQRVYSQAAVEVDRELAPALWLEVRAEPRLFAGLRLAPGVAVSRELRATQLWEGDTQLDELAAWSVTGGLWIFGAWGDQDRASPPRSR